MIRGGHIGVRGFSGLRIGITGISIPSIGGRPGKRKPVTPPEPSDYDSLLLEQGGYILLNNGFRITLER